MADFVRGLKVTTVYGDGTTEAVSRATYMNYGFLTVLPFTVIVYERA